MDTVYISHVLEHLDDATVARVLQESRRVLNHNGRLVIKIPDFERTLEAWRHQDPDFFTNELWDYDRITPTWGRRNIPDNLDFRTAMLFCGFWNDHYGDHFARPNPGHHLAYHGPPVVPPDRLRKLFLEQTPSRIASELCSIVTAKETFFHFNHQNAWSRQELAKVVESAGFWVESFDAPHIVDSCADIPDINSMQYQSMYCLARKHLQKTDVN